MINPSNTEITLTHGDEQTPIPAEGAIQLTPENGTSLDLSADIPLVIFEEVLGANWSTLNAPSP